VTEWLKLIASALLGLIVGLLLEPIKFLIANRMKIRLLRDGLHSNLAFVSGKCNWKLVDELRQSQTKTIYDEYWGELHYADRPRSQQDILDDIATVDLEVFRYYYEQEKPIFWRLEFASRLKSIYSELAKAVDIRADESARLEAARNVDTRIRNSLKDGALDRNLFFQYTRKYFGDDYTSAYSESLTK
jgi:hypothetical protein